MSTYDPNGIERRSFLKYAGVAAGASLVGISPNAAFAAEHLGETFLEVVTGARLYMTHYALFQEPDPAVPQALYFDATNGIPVPTAELILLPPLTTSTFTRSSPNPTKLTAPADTSKLLPYVVTPPGFPPLPPPPQIVQFLQFVTGLDANTVASNTKVFITAIGQFVGEGPATGRLTGANFEVTKPVHFEVRIRIGFKFTPPAGVGAPPVVVLVAWLTEGTLAQLIPQLPPPPNPNEVVVYSWSAPMTLSTRNSYVRTFASQPPPVADPFPAGQSEIAFVGSKVDDLGGFTIVGSASPQEVTFSAPTSLQFFLFGTNQLTDVEFAVEQSGLLVPLGL
jgi:hypothetical protein